MSISRRFDSLSEKFGTFLMFGSLGAVVVVTLAIIIPDANAQADIADELAAKQKEIKALEEEGARLLDELSITNDPYYVEQFAVDHYRYLRIDPALAKRWREYEALKEITDAAKKAEAAAKPAAPAKSATARAANVSAQRRQ